MLDGKVAIITGGGRGIGFACAMEMARQGAKILLNDFGIDGDGLHPEPSVAAAAVEKIKATGGEAAANTSDVATAEGVREIFKDCIDAFGTVDILYNNAAFMHPKPFLEIEADEWRRTFDVSVKGTFLCCKLAVPIMKEKGWGRIFNVSSPGGLWGSPLQTHKGAVSSMTTVLYKEVYEYGITVNTLVPNAPTRDIPPEIAKKQQEESSKWLRPGLISTGEPDVEKIGPIVAYLASEECDDITGRSIFIAGDVIAEYSDVDLINSVISPGGWTYEALDKHFHHIVPAGPPSAYVGDRSPAKTAVG